VAPPLISIIVPTFRRFDPLLRTLEDLLAQDYPRFEIIVADQNPEWPDTCRAAIVKIQQDARVQWMSLGTPGVVIARNRAVAASRGDVLLFVDDDVLVPERTLVSRHAANYDDPSVMAVVGRERQPGDRFDLPSDSAGAAAAAVLPSPPGQTPLQQALWFNRNGDRRQQVCTFCTCNSSVRRSAWLAVDGFDERFRGNSYGDDYDFALRLHARGDVIVYDPTAWLVHLRAPAGGLRLTDRQNPVDMTATAEGLWLFVLRHGHRGMYGWLIWNHVLRKTVALRRYLFRPWQQVRVAWSVTRALPRAFWHLRSARVAGQ
jgi:GT2 family glycosyltransferase